MSAPRVAIVGSGPAALMAATRLAARGVPATLFEKRKSPGRKLLVAGSSGLNISNSLPLAEFAAHYSPHPDDPKFWQRVIGAFPPAQWIEFIESLGVPTFEGTSGRYFIEDMKASRFLQSWIKHLTTHGIEIQTGFECTAITPQTRTLGFSDGSEQSFDAILFALGGGSWEPTEVPLRWPTLFKDLAFASFESSNCGYRVDWPVKFTQEAAGKPLKKIIATSKRAKRPGDAMATDYGIEGPPIYFAGMTGEITLDLRPDLTEQQILEKLQAVRENLSPIRRVKKTLSLCDASLALVFHLSPKEVLNGSDLTPIAQRIKKFPLTLLGPQPLTEAISSSGGLSLGELDSEFMIKKWPGIYAAGEMLDWDVPTGGFLLQACVAQGAIAGDAIAARLK